MAKQAVKSSSDTGCPKFEPSKATIADAITGGPYPSDRRFVQATAKAGITMEAAEE